MDEFLTIFIGLMSYSNLIQDVPEFRDSPSASSNDSSDNGKENVTTENGPMRIDLPDGSFKLVWPCVRNARPKALARIEEAEQSRLLTPNVDINEWKTVSA